MQELFICIQLRADWLSAEVLRKEVLFYKRDIHLKRREGQQFYLLHRPAYQSLASTGTCPCYHRGVIVHRFGYRHNRRAR